MASTLNADNGAISGSSGLKNSADASGVLALQTNGTTALTIDTSQNVGIGTSSPGSLLDLRFSTNPVIDNGAGNNTLRIWTKVTQAAGVGGALSLGGYYDGTPNYASFGQIAGRKENSTSGNLSGYLQFATNNSTGTMSEWMRIDSSGNLRLGVTSISAGLFNSVGGTGSVTTGYFAASDANNTGISITNIPSQNKTLIASQWNTSGTALAFGAATSEFMRINNTGGVAIGTTDTNNALLTIDRGGSSSGQGLLVRGDTSGYSDGLTVTYAGATSANSRFQAYISNYNGIVDLKNGSNTNNVRLHANGESFIKGGSLLIGKSTSNVPTNGVELLTSGETFNTITGGTGLNTLHVYSSTAGAYRFYVSNAGQINATSTTIAGISDARLKENVNVIENGLTTVGQLNPVTYNFKDMPICDDGKVTHYGFLAQEVKDILPTLVTEGLNEAEDGSKYLTLKMGDMLPILVKAIQELKAEIDSLKAQISG